MRACSVEGCERQYLAKGYCAPHYERVRSGKSLDTPIRVVRVKAQLQDNLGRLCCKTCAEWLDPSMFWPSTHFSTTGRLSRCKTCQSKYNRNYRHGVTPEAVDAMLQAQGGGCAICRIDMAGSNCNLDHDHKCCPGRRSCGRCARGLLCNKCNVMLGMVGDSVELLQTAISYLEEYTLCR